MNTESPIANAWDAAVIDLDGVVTQTAQVHAHAWASMFNEYLRARPETTGENHAPFEDQDYREYVDGRPRYDGVRTFLESRGIHLPLGAPSDRPNQETVCGLGNRKNELFHELLAAEGPKVFDDAITQIKRWRARGIKTAMVSSSRNAGMIIDVAGIRELFDVTIDGADAARLGLPGKPAPDTFLEAAKRLGADPARTIFVEDAISGVQAGRAGNFGLVVGVAREGNAEALRENGADRVVQELTELEDLHNSSK
jgi:beta-phosphoglucomutase family hydrolase